MPIREHMTDVAHCVDFYFRNVTEIILFGVRGKNADTLRPERSQTNVIAARKREHSRKPGEQYEIIERCSTGPYLELFWARSPPQLDCLGWSSAEYVQARLAYIPTQLRVPGCNYVTLTGLTAAGVDVGSPLVDVNTRRR